MSGATETVGLWEREPARPPVRCCFISTKAYPLFNPDCSAFHGGAELQVYYLATELARSKDVDVSCIVGDFGQASIEVRRGVRLIRAFKPHGAEGLATKLAQSSKYWALLRRVRADIIITTTSAPVALIAALYARFTRAKHVHRTAHERDTDLRLRMPVPLRNLAYIMGIRMAHAVITQSENHKRALRRHGIDATIVRNVLPLPEGTALGFGERNHILWVGRYVDFKQPEMFLALARELPDISFVMICQQGIAPTAAYEDFLSRATALPNLRVLPGIPFESTVPYFREARALVSTSASEGFPNTFLQAFSEGTPVVSLNVNPDGLFDRYSVGRFCSGSFAGLVQAVRTLWQDKDQWEAHGRDGTRYLRDWHDPEQNAGVLHSLINRLCANSPCGKAS